MNLWQIPILGWMTPEFQIRAIIRQHIEKATFESYRECVKNLDANIKTFQDQFRREHRREINKFLVELAIEDVVVSDRDEILDRAREAKKKAERLKAVIERSQEVTRQTLMNIRGGLQ